MIASNRQMTFRLLKNLPFFVGLGFARRLRDDAGKVFRRQRLAAFQRIQAEPPGNYFIGRRYYKQDFHFWGYIRRPGQPWSTAQLVMLNENQKLAPDREQINFGFDNNYECKLYGHFSGDTVYEPASNGVYPEFVPHGLRADLDQPLADFQKPIQRLACRPISNRKAGIAGRRAGLTTPPADASWGRGWLLAAAPTTGARRRQLARR